MTKTADDIFAAADLPKQGHEYIYARVERILNDTMAELSVATSAGYVTWAERIQAYDSQIDSLIKELTEFKRTLHP